MADIPDSFAGELLESMDWYEFAWKKGSKYTGQCCFVLEQPEGESIVLTISTEAGKGARCSLGYPDGKPSLLIRCDVKTFLGIYNGQIRHSRIVRMVLSGRIRVSGGKFREFARFNDCFDYSTDCWRRYYATLGMTLEEALARKRVRSSATAERAAQLTSSLQRRQRERAEGEHLAEASAEAAADSSPPSAPLTADKREADKCGDVEGGNAAQHAASAVFDGALLTWPELLLAPPRSKPLLSSALTSLSPIASRSLQSAVDTYRSRLSSLAASCGAAPVERMFEEADWTELGAVARPGQLWTRLACDGEETLLCMRGRLKRALQPRLDDAKAGWLSLDMDPW